MLRPRRTISLVVLALLGWPGCDRGSATSDLDAAGRDGGWSDGRDAAALPPTDLGPDASDGLTPGPTDGGAATDLATEDAGAQPRYRYEVPLAPDSPWPKFRRTPRQDGRSPLGPAAGHADDRPWVFPTGKGIFSSPVIGGDGTVYLGSADRTFYALTPRGEPRWSVPTGEIIDSAALLDDRGRVYFGSGDGLLRALDAATGEPVWTFAADEPEEGRAFIRWFEGNVAIGPRGTLYAPNDNFRIYAVDRETGLRRWFYPTQDQTWSLPAVDPTSDRLYVGNNNLLEFLGGNVFGLQDRGETVALGWEQSSRGSVAASPLLTADGRVLVGGFDGYLRCYAAEDGRELWAFPTRDHLYASPAQLPDGTVLQPSADGTIYALDPAEGRLLWAFDTREPLRSSPAVDVDGNSYFGSGEGRLYVLQPDGRLRWAMQLVAEGRNDLNGSPALGEQGVVIGGESGELFGIPWDWCLTAAGQQDSRCLPPPPAGASGEELPDDGVFLLYTTPFGGIPDLPPAEVEPHGPLAFSLFVRQAGDTVLAHLDAEELSVTVDPSVELRVTISGDRRFLLVEPVTRLAAGPDGRVRLTIRGRYLVEPAREGLAFSGGRVGGPVDAGFSFRLQEDADAPVQLPLPFPAQAGAAAGVWELSRLAAPLPSLLPSYNQIGFDSLHFLVGLVEGDGQRGVAWAVGAQPDGAGGVAVDPRTATLFPLLVRWQPGGLLTLEATQGLALEVMNFSLAFSRFTVATRLDADAATLGPPRLAVQARCAEIPFYGAFLRLLGLCNPQTDGLIVYGTALLQPQATGRILPPAGVGEVELVREANRIVARLMGSELSLTHHRFALLLVDPASGEPIPLDYAAALTVAQDDQGHPQQVTLRLPAAGLPRAVRVHLLVDTYPVATATLEEPAE